MVDAELRFAEPVTAVLQAAVFDEVVRAQVGQAGIQCGLRNAVSVDHPLGAKLMVLGITGLFEGKVVGHGLGTVGALAVGIVEVPPAPGQVVVEHLAVGGVLMVAHGVMATTDQQLVGQAQRAVPLQAITPLLFAGGALPFVVT